jgi:hypothetical protein
MPLCSTQPGLGKRERKKKEKKKTSQPGFQCDESSGQFRIRFFQSVRGKAFATDLPPLFVMEIELISSPDDEQLMGIEQPRGWRTPTPNCLTQFYIRSPYL